MSVLADIIMDVWRTVFNGMSPSTDSILSTVLNVFFGFFEGVEKAIRFVMDLFSGLGAA